MTMTELAELILTRLYELANEQGREKLHDINEIAKSFQETDVMKVYNAVQFLESKKFIKAFCFQDALCRGFIEYHGEHYVDTGGETGIIGKYKRNPSVYYIGNYTDNSLNINKSNLSGVNISTHSKNVKQAVEIHPEAEKILSQMIETLRKDSLLPDSEKNDALRDIDCIKNQLSKSKKDHNIIKSILLHLAQIASIGSLAINAYRLFYGSP